MMLKRLSADLVFLWNTEAHVCVGGSAFPAIIKSTSCAVRVHELLCSPGLTQRDAVLCGNVFYRHLSHPGARFLATAEVNQ